MGYRTDINSAYIKPFHKAIIGSNHARCGAFSAPIDFSVGAHMVELDLCFLAEMTFLAQTSGCPRLILRQDKVSAWLRVTGGKSAL